MIKKSDILFVLFILLMVWVVVGYLQKIRPDNYDPSDLSSRPKLNGGSQSELGRRDCNVELLYAMDDEQCSAICREPGIFRVRNGACVNVLAFESKTAVSNTCDPKHGVLAYLIGNSQFGSTSLLCLSVDLGIQPDDSNGRNRICENGSVEIDYLRAYPQIENCECESGKILTFVESTSTIRSYGVCVPDSLRKTFEYNGLLYTPN